jgi:hypothetical protein
MARSFLITASTYTISGKEKRGAIRHGREREEKRKPAQFFASPVKARASVSLTSRVFFRSPLDLKKRRPAVSSNLMRQYGEWRKARR